MSLALMLHVCCCCCLLSHQALQRDEPASAAEVFRARVQGAWLISSLAQQAEQGDRLAMLGAVPLLVAMLAQRPGVLYRCWAGGGGGRAAENRHTLASVIIMISHYHHHQSVA